MSSIAWEMTPRGLLLTIRLTPKGGTNAVEGLVDLAFGRCALKARVRAAPEKGKANAALLALLSNHLNVPVSMLELQKGDSQRVKVVSIAPAAAEQAQEALQACHVKTT